MSRSGEAAAAAAAEQVDKKKLTLMEISRLFLFRKDLQEVRNRLDIDKLNSVIKRIADKPKTLEEQHKLLNILGNSFAEKEVGRWQVGHSGRRYWCPHHIPCLTEDECYDKQEHDRTRYD